MDTSSTSELPSAGGSAVTDPHAPNHHALYPAFAGLRGLLAALTMVPGRQRDAALAAELVGLRTDDRLVDLGCGPGVAARFAAGRCAEVVAVDPAAVMLRTARLLDLRRRVELRVGAAEDLPVADGWASAIWTLASVHHWPDVDGGIAEARRVLAPGGRFVAVEQRIDPTASGLASHGWTRAQADSFARRCRTRGFATAEVLERPGRRGAVLAVLATVEL